VVPGEHFSAQFADIHMPMSGDGCPKCRAPIRVEKTIEIGNIFKLGTKYSVPLKAVYLDAQGQEKPIVMGSYGIGPARIIAAAVEQNHDPNGIIFPLSIAPFQVHLLPVNLKQGAVGEEAEKLYQELSSAKVEALYDDREEAPGVKFKDADLLGTPLRLTLSNKTLKEKAVEVKERRSGQVRMIQRDQAVSWVKDWIDGQMKK
jgi:prolyl-tRNA synthetase